MGRIKTKLRFTNEFHGRVAYALVPANGVLTPRQVRRLWSKLCGVRGCTCSDETGSRGFDNPDYVVLRDGSASILRH